jgi:hypothetical protein
MLVQFRLVAPPLIQEPPSEIGFSVSEKFVLYVCEVCPVTNAEQNNVQSKTWGSLISYFSFFSDLSIVV